MDKLYHSFLYVMGFPTKSEEIGTGGLYITDMLQLQKQRFPKAWWVMSILSVFLSFCLFIFNIWLLLHVIGIRPFGTPRKEGE